jgi:hypothetical protein
MRKIGFVLLLLTCLSSGCVDHSIEQEICYQGIVLGKIRSAGGGIAVSMEDITFSTHQWRGYQNVIEALNVPLDAYKTGEKIYFTDRTATHDEQVFPISADGDESNKPIVYLLEISSINCPSLGNSRRHN